jgi:hypothetical protein
VINPLSRSEIVARAVTETRLPGPEYVLHRACIASALQHGPRWLRDAPEIQEAVTALQNDESPEVRQAASWLQRA